MALWNWLVLIAFGAMMWWISPRLSNQRATREFFHGASPEGKQVSLAFLSASLLISWIFAKSIQNTANLSQAYGAPGALAYALYWLSFVVAGFSLYRLRNLGYSSIHQFITSRFGLGAMWLFSLILVFRLWNEIWSNTIVVAMFFGEQGSMGFYAAAWVSTALILVYTLKSGFRSSIYTDVIQMALASILLLIILGLIFPKASPAQLVQQGQWSLEGGLDLALVALIQVWSYPFHDPVMTDRAFLTDKQTMLRAFVLAGVFGVIFIFLFGFVGLFNQLQGIGGNATLSTSYALGGAAMLFMNGIMLTSAASTLDSTFSSAGKLVAVDLFGLRHREISTARLTMILLAVLGGLMVHANPAILSATTVSGTMVIGLAPVFLLAGWERPGAMSYHFSLLTGLACGVTLATKMIPFSVGAGNYGSLLWINIAGTIVSFAGYIALAYLFPNKCSKQMEACA